MDGLICCHQLTVSLMEILSVEKKQIVEHLTLPPSPSDAIDPLAKNSRQQERKELFFLLCSFFFHSAFGCWWSLPLFTLVRGKPNEASDEEGQREIAEHQLLLPTL
jgi:hypothetical protein